MRTNRTPKNRIGKTRSLASLNYNLNYVRHHAKFRIEEVDDKVTALNASPSKYSEDKIIEASRDIFAEYTISTLKKCEEFLSPLRLVKTGKYYSELHKYEKILGEIKENLNLTESLLIAAKNLFDSTQALWQELQDSKHDFDDEKRKTFLTYYTAFAALTAPIVFWILGEGISLDRRIAATVIALCGVYYLLKKYFDLP